MKRTATAFHFVWDIRIWKDSTAVLERKQSELMNFRSWTQKRVKFNNRILRKQLSSGLWRRVVWQKCTEAANWDSRMLRNVGTFVTDNTASVRRDIMLHISILRSPEQNPLNLKYRTNGTELLWIIRDTIANRRWKSSDMKIIVLWYICVYIYIYIHIHGARGGVLVKALRYKPEGRGYDSRWCQWKFSVK